MGDLNTNQKKGVAEQRTGLKTLEMQQEENFKELKKFKEIFDDVKVELHNKLSKKDIKAFSDKVAAIPTHSQFKETQNYVNTQIQLFNQSIKSEIQKLNQTMEIIARYDEVLCEKAQKHQIIEL